MTISITKGAQEFVGAAEAELLRRKYRVSVEGLVFSVGLGEFHDLIRVELLSEDLAKTTMEFCDEVEDALKGYLAELSEHERGVAHDGEQLPRTTEGVIRQDFVVRRSERLKKAAR